LYRSYDIGCTTDVRIVRATNSAYEMTYIVSGGALNSTHSRATNVRE